MRLFYIIFGLFYLITHLFGSYSSENYLHKARMGHSLIVSLKKMY